MDVKLDRYRSVIKTLLTQLAEWANQSQEEPDIQSIPVFDESRDQYLLISVGWQGDRRQRGLHVYIRIKGEKVWLEEDMTDIGIADRLVEGGIPKQDIVLGFRNPKRRGLTEFAAA